MFLKVNSLKNSGYRVSTDLLIGIVNRRKLHAKKLVEVRKADKIAFFSRTEPDKLFIDGVFNPLEFN